MTEQQSRRTDALVRRSNMRWVVPMAGAKASAQSMAGYLAAVLALTSFSIAPAVAQQARWYQLSEQVLQLREHGKFSEALPLAQEVVQVAQATYGQDDRHVALSLNELGLVFENLEKFPDAEAALRQAESINEKLYGLQSNETASNLNNLADLYRVEGRYADAEKLFQQALSIHEKLLDPNDPELAVNVTNLAVVYAAEGKYAAAEPLYLRAIAIDEKAKGPEDASVALDDSNLATLYEEEGKYSEAEPLDIKALTIHMKVLGKDHPTVAADMGNLAVLYSDEAKFTYSEHAFVGARAIAEKALGPDNSTVAWILDGQAGLYREEGRYAEAEPLIRRAIAIREKVLGENHPDVAQSLGQLGGLYAVEGKYADAELLYRRAMTINLKALGQENPRIAAMLTNMASMYIDEARLADAERMLRGALAIDIKALGPTHHVVARNLTTLASVYEDEGKLADAESLYQQSSAILEKSLGPDHPQVAGNLIGLASVYEHEGKFAQAEPLFRRALTTYETSFGPEHPSTGEAQMNLAVFYYDWDKPDQAGPYFDKRIGNLMDQFKTDATYMSEKDRLTFLGTVPGAFPLFFSFALKYHDRDPALAGKVYDALLEEKGFVAASAAALRAKILASGDQQTLAMLEKLTAMKTELAGLVASTQGDPADRRKQIAQLGQQANLLEQEIVKRSSALADEKTLSVVTWRDVQKTLKLGEAAVEIARFQFHNGKSFTSTVYYIALVVTPVSKTPDFVVLGEAQKLESASLAGYRAHVGQTRGLTAEAAPGEAQATGAEGGDTSAAYDAFWKPLEPALAGVKRVYVSPDGVLNQIPIGLLADRTGKLLLEKYQLRIVNSTKDLLRPQHAAQLKSALLVGNPKFDLTEAEQRTALTELSGGIAHPAQVGGDLNAVVLQGQREGALSGGSLNPLPGTQVEVNEIVRLLKNSGWQISQYTGEHALQEAVERQRSPRVVHIATHGFFLSDQDLAPKSKTASAPRTSIMDPMLRSGLFFAGADRVRAGAAPIAGLDDGVLTAYQASQLDLEGTELVVLSACETGLGQQSNGEGVFGLRRGLQEAGASAVMMSMWSVPDRETQELVALFYAKWLGGMDMPEALRQAQLQERETVRTRYGKDLPFYWGAFVLVSR